MARFDPREYGRTPSSRFGKLLVLGASIAILAGLSVLVTGGFAQSRNSLSAFVAAAKKKGYVSVCPQRHRIKYSQGDLNVLVKSQCAKGQKPLKLALWPAKDLPESKAPRTGRTARTRRSDGSRWRCRCRA